MRRPFKRKLVINHPTLNGYSASVTEPREVFSTQPAREGVLACSDLSPVKLRRFSNNLTNTITVFSGFNLGMPVQQPKLLQDLGKRLKAWRSPDNGKEGTTAQEPETQTCLYQCNNNDNSLTDSGVGVAHAEDSGIYAEIGPPTVTINTGSRPSSAPSRRSPPTSAKSNQRTTARPRSKSLRRSGSSSRKARDLFRCTSGQRSRSCTPERNVNYRVNPPPNMGNAGNDENYFRHPPAPPIFRPAQVTSKTKTGTSIFSLRRLSFRRKSLPKEPSKKTTLNSYTDVPGHARGVEIPPKDKDAISRDSGQDSETDYESVSSESPETWLKQQRSYTISEGTRSAVVVTKPKYSGLTSPPDLPTIRRVDHLYGTVRRREKKDHRRSKGASAGPSSTKDSGVVLSSCDHVSVLRGRGAPQEKIGPPPPPPRGTAPSPQSGVSLVKVLRLDKFLTNKWISGVAVTKKNEYIVVDLRSAYLLDEDGNLKKMVGAKNSNRLQEPIDVAVMPNGNLVFSDHAEQDVKIFNWKGQYLRKVKDKGLPNIAGVATNEKRQIFIAGTDKQRISVHTEDDELLYTIPGDNEGKKAHFEHPYSVAVNPLTGDIIVGDDYKQLVTAVSPAGKILWRFCPPGDRHRHFFPSSICVDNDGYVFIADLYNEKVYMLDSSGKYLKTVLSRGEGLKGGPGAVATDGRGHLIVADEEKTLKVFKYGENGFAVNRRFSYCPTAI